MFENVYTNPDAKGEEGKAESLIETLYTYHINRPDRLPEEYRLLISERGELPERVVCDYISSMSDRYAISLYNSLFVPMPWLVK